MSNDIVAKQLDVERNMLWGDRLRVLLNSNQITYGEINTLLRRKGIFVDSSDKAVIVPLLSSCLLTPEEFSSLISLSYTRESLEKYKTDKLTLNPSASDWRQLVIDNFDEIIGGLSLDSGHTFVKNPTITSGKDQLEIQYTIKKQDYSKDWIDQELQFSGGMVISKRDGELILELEKTHTSKETDRINNIFAKSLTSHLKKNNIVNEDTPQSIKFNDFSNEERVKFFLLLTGANHMALNFDELSEVEIVRDEGAGALPNDPSVQWMEGKVKNIRISGEKLDQLGLVKESKFHKFCLLVKMSASYKFTSGVNKGKCSVIFSFGGKSTSDRDFSNTEFHISIERIPRLSGEEEKDARRSILRSLCDLRDKAITTIHNAR
jgi:hypothetical protein